jgi:putative membrane protein
MAWLFAFLHHAAAFALVAALAVELVLLRGELTAQNVSLVKLALFVLLALVSVYPTVAFLSWRRTPPDAARVPPLRRIVHLELAGVVVILLCAALMARGIGSTTT